VILCPTPALSQSRMIATHGATAKFCSLSSSSSSSSSSALFALPRRQLSSCSSDHHLNGDSSSAHEVSKDGRETRVWWRRQPKTALLVKKFRDPLVTHKAIEVANYLSSRGICVVVDSWRNALDMEDRYKVVNPRSEDARIDLVICLGGDGTILHANNILNTLKDHVKGIQNLPPVISFAMGSLGFLTPFSASDWFPTLEHILGAKTEEEGVHCSMRTRLICTVGVVIVVCGGAVYCSMRT